MGHFFDTLIIVMHLGQFRTPATLSLIVVSTYYETSMLRTRGRTLAWTGTIVDVSKVPDDDVEYQPTMDGIRQCLL